ncbi:MAG: PqqD family peptide modification chaperone [Candidatus Melainabacteria bacterium]|nr:PqqD family peptide modification chaperone [Candidatus Melainabacteria bacterium]
MQSIIQLKREGIKCSYTEKDIDDLLKHFSENHWVKLPKLLDEEILGLIQEKIKIGDFYSKSYKKKIGLDSKELRLKDKQAIGLLEFLTNDPKFFELIEKITSSKKIGCFSGRIYRLSPDADTLDAWHDDNVDNRMIAMSVNLSTEVYEGGSLQIKDFTTDKIIQEVKNTGFGDAVIFRISNYLDHRVTEVKGKAHRTAYAGWFFSEPFYKPVFKPVAKNRTNDNSYEKLPQVQLSASVKKNRNLFSKYFNERLHVFNPFSTSCFALNAVGERVLQVIDKPFTVSEVKNVLLKEFDIETEQCEKDLLYLLKEMEENGLVSIE